MMNGTFFDASIDNSLNKDSRIYKLLNKNIGKKIIIHISVPGNSMYDDKTFDGILENITDEYIIIYEPNSGNYQLILLIYVIYISFEEEINN